MATTTVDTPQKRRLDSTGVTLAATIVLFAVWGMAHNLNDILIAQFRRAFQLSDLRSSLVQSAFYITYLITPIPIALYTQRFGFRRAVVLGLALYGCGALLFWPAAEMMRYGAFLTALFVLAGGVVVLECSGCGLVTALGAPERAEWRINLAQAFNPVGSITGILIGREFIFADSHGQTTAALTAAQRVVAAHTVLAPYVTIGVCVLLLAGAFTLLRVPPSADARPEGSAFDGVRVLVRSPVFMFGVLAQFFYVGAQVGIWSFLIRYVQAAAPGVSLQDAAWYLTASLACLLVGRFVNLALLRRWSSAQLAMVYALAAAGLCAYAALRPGPVAAVALVAVSLFMSVMYPAIYSIALHGRLQYVKSGSALITMSIVGGAVLSTAMGAVSDISAISRAYLVPVVSFMVIFGYALAAVRRGQRGPAVGGAPGAH